MGVVDSNDDAHDIAGGGDVDDDSMLGKTVVEAPPPQAANDTQPSGQIWACAPHQQLHANSCNTTLKNILHDQSIGPLPELRFLKPSLMEVMGGGLSF